MKKKKQADNWKNRIVGSGEMPASKFAANPLNARTHPKAQQAALVGSLTELGWIQNVIVNKTTGNVIDGHARISEALKLGDNTPVPYVEVELTLDEERLALATLDPISAMAEYDKTQLDALLREVNTGDEALQTMLAELSDGANSAALKDDSGKTNDRGIGIDLLFKPVFKIKSVFVLEKAIEIVGADGERNRGDAIEKIAQFYLDNHEKR